MSDDEHTARHTSANERDANRSTVNETYQLQNSLVSIEKGRNGYIATIQKPDTVEWAGPLDEETTDAIREVAANV